jgi:hypothetical protein
MNDTIDFAPVNPADVRRDEPIRATFPNGVVFEELRANTGAFRKYDPKCGVTMEHSQRIDYASTLGEQYLQMRGAA